MHMVLVCFGYIISYQWVPVTCCILIQISLNFAPRRGPDNDLVPSRQQAIM